MSSQRPSAEFAALTEGRGVAPEYDVFDSRGVVFGSATRGVAEDAFLFVNPTELRGRRVVHPFYTSSHPNNSKLSVSMQSIVLRVLQAR
tara:strand:- start:3167 stop:3433 length:267 start_codon:yes stop_codon:yes gene_type:complete